MSNFSALQTALSGLISHQQSLQTAGHNAANAATSGFSRQRVDLMSAGGGVVPAVWSKSDGIGNGVKVAGLIRIRDEFLEARALNEIGKGAALTAQHSVASRIEMIFPEPSDVGVAHQLAELWGAFDDLANQPGAQAPRIALLERARTVTDELNRGATELHSLHRSSVDHANALVQEVNATVARVAELNGAIRNATAAGLSPHDLADQRDRLIERLGETAGVTTRAGELGTMDVFLGGSALVRGDRYEQLTFVDTDATPPGGTPDPNTPELHRYAVQWAKDGYPAVVNSGEIGGLLEASNVMVPHYLSELNKVAGALASHVNIMHQSGFDLSGVAGDEFFVGDANGLSAMSIKVNSALMADPGKIAAASADPLNPTQSAGALDAGNATGMAQLGERGFYPNGPDALYSRLIGGLGIETQALARRNEIQTEVTAQVDMARESVRGVNIDEEMVAMVQAQHAYAAAARLMTAIDEMLQTLIHSTGLVGR